MFTLPRKVLNGQDEKHKTSYYVILKKVTVDNTDTLEIDTRCI